MEHPADDIATTLADIRDDRCRHLPWRDELGHLGRDVARQVVTNGELVDVTAVYRSIIDADKEIFVYEDHPCIAPPFQSASYCWITDIGNVRALITTVNDLTADNAPEPTERWETAEPVDWSRVRWTINVAVYAGGRSGGRPLPTIGPTFMWWIAVYEDGEPADIHWQQTMEQLASDDMTNELLVLLGALSLFNCGNVELVEPVRPKPKRRRIARTGVRLTTIGIRPIGKRSKSRQGSSGVVVPSALTPIRGHFAHYGPKYGKGLLFGKYEGRFFISQHARGSLDGGQVEHTYVVEPEPKKS